MVRAERIPESEARGPGVEMKKLVAVGASRLTGHEGEQEGAGEESGRDGRKNWSTQVEARLSAVVKVGVRSGWIAREGAHRRVP